MEKNSYLTLDIW